MMFGNNLSSEIDFEKRGKFPSSTLESWRGDPTDFEQDIVCVMNYCYSVNC
jgi:hypothetical protein